MALTNYQSEFQILQGSMNPGHVKYMRIETVCISLYIRLTALIWCLFIFFCLTISTRDAQIGAFEVAHAIDYVDNIKSFHTRQEMSEF